MSELYGLHVKFRAHPRMGDELERILLEAAAAAPAASAQCRLYLVGRVA